MIASTSYPIALKRAQSILGWEKSQRTFYTDYAELKKLLLSFNISSEKGRLVRRWASLSETAIVAINHNEKTNNWYWVVYHREAGVAYVLDPQSKREVRNVLGRMRLRPCLPMVLPLIQAGLAKASSLTKTLDIKKGYGSVIQKFALFVPLSQFPCTHHLSSRQKNSVNRPNLLTFY